MPDLRRETGDSTTPILNPTSKTNGRITNTTTLQDEHQLMESGIPDFQSGIPDFQSPLERPIAPSSKAFVDECVVRIFSPGER